MATPSVSSPKAEQARLITYDQETRVAFIREDSPAFRPLQEADILVAGEDFLRRQFFAGTPCSKTHLIWIVVEGGLTIDFGDGDGAKPVAPGQLAISPSMRPHWVRLATPQAKGVWFHLHNTPRWEYLYGVGPCIRPACYLPDLEWLMDHCLAEQDSPEPEAIQNSLNYAKAIAVVLRRELATAGTSSLGDLTGIKLDRFWGEVAVSLGSKWTVGRIAQRVAISESHLHRICEQRYGIGPIGVVARMRIDRAMELLSSTQRKLDDIAEEVGYANAYAFSDSFERHVGQRPSIFRAQRNG